MAVRRIFLLEDDPALRVVLVDALTSEGHAVNVCDSYAGLLRALEQRGCDLVLADFWGESHNMLNPADRQQIADLGKQTALVLVTGRAWAERCTPGELGIAGLLLKPFELDTLLDTIEQTASA